MGRKLLRQVWVGRPDATFQASLRLIRLPLRHALKLQRPPKYEAVDQPDDNEANNLRDVAAKYAPVGIGLRQAVAEKHNAYEYWESLRPMPIDQRPHGNGQEAQGSLKGHSGLSTNWFATRYSFSSLRCRVRPSWRFARRA